MANVNVDLVGPRRNLYRFLQFTPLQVLNHFIPWLADKLFVYKPTDRLLEYPFIHQNIPFNGKGSKILDIGSGNSTLPLELASKGYQVWAIDLKRGYLRSIRHSNFTFIQGDIRRPNFQDDFFDIVTAVSSIEHIGLDGREVDFGGDKVALQQIFRILKAGGKLLITVPFGKRGVYHRKGHPYWRVHDLSSLTELLAGFEIKMIKFGLREEVSYRPASLEEVRDIDSLSQPVYVCSKAIAMVVARKLGKEVGKNDKDSSM